MMHGTTPEFDDLAKEVGLTPYNMESPNHSRAPGCAPNWTA